MVHKQIGNLESLCLATQTQLALLQAELGPLDRANRPRLEMLGAYQPIETDFCDEHMTDQCQTADDKRLMDRADSSSDVLSRGEPDHHHNRPLHPHVRYASTDNLYLSTYPLHHIDAC